MLLFNQLQKIIKHKENTLVTFLVIFIVCVVLAPPLSFLASKSQRRSRTTIGAWFFGNLAGSAFIAGAVAMLAIIHEAFALDWPWMIVVGIAAFFAFGMLVSMGVEKAEWGTWFSKST